MIFDAPLKEWLWNFLGTVFEGKLADKGAAAADARRQPASRGG